MMKPKPYTALKQLVASVGKSEARRLLVVEGVSPHTADKLIGGRYPSEVGQLVGGAITRALETAKMRVS